MTDYDKLVAALRHCADSRGMVNCNTICEYGWRDSYGCKNILMADAADAIEALQAEVARYKDAFGRLSKTAVELEQRVVELKEMPKRGKWVEDTTTHAGPGLSNYKCSLCGKICGTWRRGLEQSELPNWCGNCGADMRKKEVQINGFNKK